MENNGTEFRSPSTYTIGTVSKLTGITPHLLRAWERRYGVVEVQRTDSNQRRYTRKDIDRLRTIKSLVDAGYRIGNLATLPDEELAERKSILVDAPPPQTGDRIQPSILLGVYGEFLSVVFERVEEEFPGIQVGVRTAAERTFSERIRRIRPDVLILEIPLIQRDTIEIMEEWAEQSGAERVMVCYQFASRKDIDLLREKGWLLLKDPGSAGDILQLLGFRIQQKGRTESPSVLAGINGQPDVPPIRFSDATLARIATASSTVECECPRHLVSLVKSLLAFEAYSAACENLNEEDAALHAYLHRSTAQARSNIEKALELVSKQEGLL